MTMPDRLEISGRWYIREDALPAPSTVADDRWEPLRELCREYGVDAHAAYNAVRAGALDARMPTGAQRGLRCKRREFVRWNDNRMAAWCG